MTSAGQSKPHKHKQKWRSRQANPRVFDTACRLQLDVHLLSCLKHLCCKNMVTCQDLFLVSQLFEKEILLLCPLLDQICQWICDLHLSSERRRTNCTASDQNYNIISDEDGYVCRKNSVLFWAYNSCFYK